jgi:hypothetical protein
LRHLGRAALLAVIVTGGPSTSVAGADSFTPVQLSIAVAPVARLHSPLAVTVNVSADAGALDNRTGPLRVRVKLATECGGTFQYTSGTVLLDKPLSPQPSAGHAYSGGAAGAGKPGAYGNQTVCVWLDDSQHRTCASDQSTQVNVSPACTAAAARYDSARRQRRRRTAAARRRQQRTLAADLAAARKACGPGVPL